MLFIFFGRGLGKKRKRRNGFANMERLFNTEIAYSPLSGISSSG
jgi:hypothetical protein